TGRLLHDFEDSPVSDSGVAVVDDCAAPPVCAGVGGAVVRSEFLVAAHGSDPDERVVARAHHVLDDDGPAVVDCGAGECVEAFGDGGNHFVLCLYVMPSW